MAVASVIEVRAGITLLEVFAGEGERVDLVFGSGLEVRPPARARAPVLIADTAASRGPRPMAFRQMTANIKALAIWMA